MARVIVVQSGARHNYALPAAFAEADMLEAFYTDLCSGRGGVGRFADFLRPLPLPGLLGKAVVGLASRRPPAAVLAHTRTDDWEALRFKLAGLGRHSLAERERLQLEHHARFGRDLNRWGLGRASHVFTVFGDGGALLHQARDLGLPILADVIIALSTRAIEEREYESYPDWGPKPLAAGVLADGSKPAQHLLTTTDVFVCPSQFVADDLVANWGVSRAATRIVPYALSGEWFEINRQPVPGRVLFVGSANRRKGIHYLAQAATDLKGRGRRYDFRVAGNAPGAVLTHPLSSSLHFLGRVPRFEIKEEFARADIFVLPTLAEGSATVVYEAMAAGLPVVTTRASGSVIEDGVDGLIVAERDPGGLAYAIERLVEDRALRDRISTNARRRAAAFGWVDYARAIRALVTESG